MAAPDAPAMTPVELMRWSWRQLTSMRTALILLFLLALGAVPGSIVPQQSVDAFRTARWQDQHPQLTPIYEKLGLFHVYNSAWFSAIYLLLMVSLVGCIIPRLGVYWRGFRSAPPSAPRNLDRLPAHATYTTDDSVSEAVAAASAALRRRRFRVDESAGEHELAAERGKLREAGNLVFHLSVIIVLVGFAIGGLFGYKGGVIVVVGQDFANSVSQYDDYLPGGLFSTEDLPPFSFTVEKFDVDWLTSGPEAGQPRDFAARLRYRTTPGQPEQVARLAVNHPLDLDGTQVFLVGHGYAPRITVRDGEGNIAYSGPVIFLPQDRTFSSFGVVKAPDARPRQIGLEGLFFPTYGFTMATGPFSRFPDALNPAISMLAYQGDLGLDSGNPQSVYELDKSGLKPMLRSDGRPYRLDLGVGQTKQLPAGAGSVTFDGVDKFVKLQLSHSPGKLLLLVGMVLGLLGLMGSLFIRPRRIWVRARLEGGRTVVEVAGLDRSSGGDLSDEIARLRNDLDPAQHFERNREPA